MDEMNDSTKRVFEIAGLLQTPDMPLVNAPKKAQELALDKGKVTQWANAPLSEHAHLVFAAGNIEEGFQQVPILIVQASQGLQVLALDYSHAPAARLNATSYSTLLSDLQMFKGVEFRQVMNTYGVALVPADAKNISVAASSSPYFPLAYKIGLFGWFALDNPHGTGFVQITYPNIVARPKHLDVSDFGGEWHQDKRKPEGPINSDVTVVALRYVKPQEGKDTGGFRHSVLDGYIALRILPVAPGETAEQVRPRLEKLL
jgi:hypothetical protein